MAEQGNNGQYQEDSLSFLKYETFIETSTKLLVGQLPTLDETTENKPGNEVKQTMNGKLEAKICKIVVKECDCECNPSVFCHQHFNTRKHQSRVTASC